MQGVESDAEGTEAQSPGAAGGPAVKPEGSRLRPQAPVLDLKATEVAAAPAAGARDDDASPPSGDASFIHGNPAAPLVPSAALSKDESGGAAESGNGAASTADISDGPPARTEIPAAKAIRRAVTVATICGAAAGALVAAVALVLGGIGDDHRSESAADTARIERMEAEVRALSARVGQGEEALRLARAVPPQLSRLEAAIQQKPAVSEPAGGKEIASLSETTKSLEAQVADLRGRLDQAASAATAARDAAMRSAGSSSAVATNAANDVESLSKRMQALEAAVQSLSARANAPNSDEAARLATAALALRGSVERGEPFAAELAALGSGRIEPAKLAALSPFADKGLPSAEALAHELSTMVAALAPHPPATAAESDTVLGRLRQAASGLIRISPADGSAAPASTPDALTALKTSAARGDLAGAVVSAEKLPDAERAQLAPWIARAHARAAAIEAARDVARAALAALSQDRDGSVRR